MSTIPTGLRYSKEHEWAYLENDGTVKIGITDHAQSELGEVVYAELPDVGQKFAVGDEFGSIESVKAVSSLYCPVSGEVVLRNDAVDESPENVNNDPYGTWLIAIRPDSVADLDQLMDAAAYTEFLAAASE